MGSELMAIILCFLGVISIFILPRFAQLWYKKQLHEEGNLTTDSEYIDVEQKKYILPLNLLTWSYRIGGIIIIAIAAFIYFSGFLG